MRRDGNNGQRLWSPRNGRGGATCQEAMRSSCDKVSHNLDCHKAISCFLHDAGVNSACAPAAIQLAQTTHAMLTMVKAGAKGGFRPLGSSLGVHPRSAKPQQQATIRMPKVTSTATTRQCSAWRTALQAVRLRTKTT